MRESFIFYGSYRKALKALPDEMRLKILDSVLDYALEGTEPNLEGVDLAFFELIRPQIDANNRKFDNGKKAAEYGSLGGRPRKEKPSETPEKPQENKIILAIITFVPLLIIVIGIIVWANRRRKK